MAQHDHDPVLVTGCSTGIGRAVVEDLLRQGHTVWATARRPDTLADLADRGAHVTALDVTDEASMSAAVAEVEAAHGAVGTLVNNAGYGEYGAVEEVDMDKVRAMFETNVFGLARMCQLVLPGMRRGRPGPHRQHRLDGRPVHLPPRWLLPRDEVRGGGPHRRPADGGQGRSASTSRSSSRASPEARSSRRPPSPTGWAASPTPPTPRCARRCPASNNEAYSNRMMSASAESVAQVVASAVAADRPRTRYLLTPAAKAMAATHTVAGDRVWDRLMARQFSL